MRVEPFDLEQWLQQESDIDLAMGGISRLRLGDVMEGAELDTLLTYGKTSGTDAIRNSVARLYAGVSLTDVLITTGSSEANFLAVYDLLEPGDKVVALNPTYMQHRELARSLGAHVEVVDLLEDQAWRPDLSALERSITAGTKLVVLVNPSNPDGSVISEQDMRDICDMADRVGAWVLCDGALRGTEVDGRLATSPVEIYERGIATGSLSKLGMPGIRIGWLVANSSTIERCWALKDYVTLSHSGLGEQIAKVALEPTNYVRYLARARGIVQENVELVSKWVNEMGALVSWTRPGAGHTSFPRYHLSIESVEFCQGLLSEEGVLLAPGDYFNCPHHFRLRHSADRGSLEEGLRRLGSYIQRRSDEELASGVQ